MKKILSCFLSFVFLFLISAPALAISENSLSSNVITEINNVLEIVEQDKVVFGLKDVDFTQISVGEAISTYNFIDNAFEKDIDIYPLFDGDQLIALSLNIDNKHQQIVTALVKEINHISPAFLALIYDASCCYLYDGKNSIYLR